ncbi:Variant-specific surface protein [Giardia duodenalis]|uniref:Variant-specific surface protein n=1 Tax=Giardia intestinalis TaxID=5741 RepID=V6TQ36_GIAIN|nr:Variant-specific surface protein [Giardia intestinalis]
MLAICFAVGALATVCQASDNKCTNNQCDTVGGTEICMSCQTGNVPINGACVAKDGVKTKCTTAASDGTEASDQTCKKCLLETFMYQGGCYETAASPGKAMCTKAVVGVCTAAAAGYFVPTGAVNTGQSVVACDDTTGVTIAAISGKYKGVQNCMTCVTSDAAPGARAEKVATCTRCQKQKYLKGNECVDGASNCDQGQFGKPDADKGNRCVSCTDQTDGVTNCETCEYNTATSKIKCTKCTDPNYLKTAADGATTCETNCGDGYFQHTATSGDLKTCQLCATGTTDAPAVSGIQNCASCTYTSSTLKCTACGEGKKPNKEGTGCFDCGISGCAYCSGTGKCEECDGDKIVKTDKDKTTSCVTEDQCKGTEGFFVKTNGSTKTCEACGDENCAACAAEGTGKCSKCKTTGDKTYLKGDAGAGTCVEASQCGSTAFPKDDAENGNKCVSCGDNTDGVANCAECTAPGEGKTKPTCTKCTDKYLKTAADGTTTCETECGEGYFKNDKGGSDGQTKVCVSCGDETSGVPNCAKCTAPTTTGQKPTCSECTSGFRLEGEVCVPASTNKSGLSTGAIAGISVAVIVMVGGLIGFCRRTE